MSDHLDSPKEPVLSTSQIKKVIENYTKSQDFIISKIVLKPMGYQYNGLVTMQFVLQVQYQTKENETESAHFFVKSINNSNKCLTGITNEMQVYEKEDFFYTKFVPLLEASGLNCEFVPKCYLCEYPTLVLENLMTKSYQSFEKLKSLDIYQSKKCLEVIAEFHLAPMIFEYNKSKTLGRKYRLIEDYGEILKNRYTCQEYGFTVKYYSTAMNALLELVNLLPGNGINKNRFIEKLEEALAVFSDNEISNEKSYTVLHGDVWATNFLYRLNGEDIQDCKIIDFQTLSYGPPGKDVVQFILSTSSGTFYKQNKTELLSFYYDHFSKIAKKYDLEASELLPEDEFQQSCSKFELGAKLYAAIDHSVTLLPDTVLSDCMSPENMENFLFVEKAAHLKEAFANDSPYRNIMSTDLSDLISMVECR